METFFTSGQELDRAFFGERVLIICVSSFKMMVFLQPHCDTVCTNLSNIKMMHPKKSAENTSIVRLLVEITRLWESKAEDSGRNCYGVDALNKV